MRHNEKKSDEMISKLISNLPYHLVSTVTEPVVIEVEPSKADDALKTILEDILPDGENITRITTAQSHPILLSFSGCDYVDSEDDEPEFQADSGASSSDAGPYAGGGTHLEFEAISDRFEGLPWKLILTKEARNSWAELSERYVGPA